METHTSNSAIGDNIGFAKEGDRLVVSTEVEEDIDLTVVGADELPTEEGEEAEVICEPNDPEAEEHETVALYARLTRLEDMRTEYDLYAVRLTSGENLTDELGRISGLKTE